MFSNIGPWQLLIILVIVLAIFGTKKLRNLGSDLGGAVKGFRSAMNEADQAAEQISDESADADLRRVLENASLLQSILDAVPQSAEAIEEGSGPTLEATEVS